MTTDYCRCGWCRHITESPLIIVEYTDGDTGYGGRFTKGICDECFEDEFGGDMDRVPEPEPIPLTV